MINNNTEFNYSLDNTNKKLMPKSSLALEFKFSCTEEYNNKFLKISKENIKIFSQNLFQKKLFLSNDNNENKEKIISFKLNDTKGLLDIELTLNELFIKNEIEIISEFDSFILGLYRNINLPTKQLILNLTTNILRKDKEYIIISNKTKNDFSLTSFEYQKKLEISPFSSYILFKKKERENLNINYSEKQLKNIDKEFFVNLNYIEKLKGMFIQNKDANKISFQCFFPNISISLYIGKLDSINVNFEIHVRFFENDQLDILINKFRVNNYILDFK